MPKIRTIFVTWLTLTALYAPAALAAPEEEAASMITDTALDAKRRWFDAAGNAADAARGTAESAYHAQFENATTAYGQAFGWSADSYGVAFRAAEGGYGAAFAHAQSGGGIGYQAAEAAYRNGFDAGMSGYSTAFGSAAGVYAATTDVATAGYSAAFHLSEDAYAWAVRAAVVAYPQGTATVYDLVRSGFLSTEQAYGLVFNPVALIDYLQGFEEFEQWTIVRAPSPADAQRQVAFAPALGAGGDELLHRPTPVASTCGDGTTPMEPARVLAAGNWRTWRNFDVGEHGEVFAGSVQFANYPFGKDCGPEWSTWHTDAIVSGRANDDVPVGYPALFDVHLRLVGSETDAYHPAIQETVNFRYGYGSKSAPPYHRAQVRDPVLFVESKPFIEADREYTKKVAIGSNDITDKICEYDCDILDRFQKVHPLAYKVAERLEGNGILARVKHWAQPVIHGVASTALYLASDYYTQPELDGRPGSGVRFVTAHVGADDEPVHLFTRLGGEYRERGEGTSRVWFSTGYWGRWQTDESAARNEPCDDWRSCQVMTGNEAIGITLHMRNGDE